MSYCWGLQGWVRGLQEISGNDGPRLASQWSPWMVTALSLPFRSYGDWRSQRVTVGYSLSNGGGRGSGHCYRAGGNWEGMPAGLG